MVSVLLFYSKSSKSLRYQTIADLEAIFFFWRSRSHIFLQHHFCVIEKKALTVSFDSSSGFTSSEQEAVLPGSQGVAPQLINPASGQLWEFCLSLPWYFLFWAKSKQRQFGVCSALPRPLCRGQWCLLSLTRNLRHSKTSTNPRSKF